MPRVVTKKLSIVAISLIACIFSFALGRRAIKAPKVCINNLLDRHLIIGIDNNIEILAEQNGPVQLEQVSVSGYAGIENDSLAGDIRATITGDNGEFVVRVDSFGLVDFKIKTKSGVVEKSILAVPVPAELYFGWSRGGKMKAAKFKVQKGVVAQVECCGFDARCEVVDYSIFRITKDNQVERANNQGGRLTDVNRRIIEAAEPGDIYWLRNLRYRCPGAQWPQEIEDISFEIE